MEMNLQIDKTRHKLYHLTTLDPLEGRENEAETLIRPFTEGGFRYFNSIVFISEKSIDAIHEHISKNRSVKYQYFLTDITANVDNGTFRGKLDKNYYPIATEAAKFIEAYKPILPTLTPEQKKDHLLDQISAKGFDSLTKAEKDWLNDYSKIAPIKNKK